MAQNADTVTYRVAAVLDGTGQDAVRSASVTVRDGSIIDVSAGKAAASAFSPSSKHVIDLGDATLLPGLVDAHVHLVWNAGPTPHEEVVLDALPARTALRMASRAWQMLASGTTTVRDLGATDSLSIPVAQAIAAGELLGPTVLASGRAIAMTGGHAFQIAVEADGPDDVRRAVREEIKRGATAIKFMASGGVYDKTAQIHQPQLTLEELTAGIDETHKAGLVAAAHAYTPGPINTALDAGIDTIEHGSFLDEATARRMAAEGQYWVPTMMAADLIVRRAVETGTPEYMRRKGELVRDAVRAAFRVALACGTPIAGGSDSGGAGIHHGRLAYEAELMVENGATALQAVSICTSGSARAIGLGDQIGTIEAGKRADILVVGGDASQDIRALTDVRLILKNGQPVSR